MSDKIIEDEDEMFETAETETEEIVFNETTASEPAEKIDGGLIILFEDNHILVVAKPQNVPTQEDSSKDPDMVNLISAYLKQKYNKEGNAFVGLVHRLDRPTGGVMVFAKTSKAASRLCEQIRNGDFDKRYLAVTVGVPRDRRARLVDYLTKDEKNNIVTRTNAAVEGSKRAELDYKVLQVVENYALLDIDLITGRSHQARVQLAGMGTPIFADAKYGGEGFKGLNLALWAYQLSFFHPVTKQIMVFKLFPPTEKTPWKHFAIERFINTAKPL